MDVLLSLVAPSLNKTLEICFLTGFATAYKLKTVRTLDGGVGRLPRQKRRQKPALADLSTLRQLGSRGSGDARTLPNDPERQGNIWSRYEQLENSSKALANVNQQLIDERSQRKKEKKRLEDTITELRQQLQGHEGLATPAGKTGGVAPQQSTPAPPLSESSKEVMREMDSPPEVRQMRSELSDARAEMQRMTEELSDAHNQLDYLRIENQDLQADVQRFQIRLGGSDGSGRRRVNRSLDAASTPFAASGPPVATFADEVAVKAAGAKGVPPQAGHNQASSLTSFGSDIEMNPHVLWTTQSSESDAAVADPQVVALRRENRALQERLETVKEAGAVAGLAGAAEMQEKLRKLQEENQRLQNKVLRLDQGPGATPPPATSPPELEEKYNKLLEENTRLQSKIVRLNLGSPGQTDAESAEVEELKEENAELREDNDKLVSYLETLEEKKKELEESLAAAGANQAASIAAINQLTAENKQLMEEVEKLREDSKATKLNSQGSFTTVHVPVSETTGEEIDTDLWMLVEELRDQNRALIEELRGAKGGQSAVFQEGSDVSRGGEAERILQLERQLAAVAESRSMEMNDDNTKLVKILADENAAVQKENMRLVKVLATRGPAGDGDVLQDLIASNERLLSEKQRMVAECSRLTEKNARLSNSRDSSDSLKQRGPMEPPMPKSDSAGSVADAKQKRGLLSRFSRSLKNKSKDGREGEELAVAGSEEGSMTSSVGAPRRELSAEGSPGSRQLVQELIEENTKLFEENKRLGQSVASLKELGEANQKLQEENTKLQSGMALVRELSEESSKLVKENKKLAGSLSASLAENQELSSRLIDLALRNEDDVFDAGVAAAFGDPQPRPAAPRGGPGAKTLAQIDTSAVKQRQEALAEQMRVNEEQNLRDAARRDELNARTASQLEAYERSRAGNSAAYKKSAASAMARLSSLSRKASVTRDTANLAREGSLASQPQEGPGEDAHEGPGGEERRRQEAHLARADLDKKIQASRRRQSEGSLSGASLASPRSPTIPEGEPSSFGDEAEAKASRAFIQFCGNDDLGGFMKALGYAGFQSLSSTEDEGQLIDVFQRAVNSTAEIQISPVTTPEEKALAVATHKYLQDWYLQYTSG